MNCEHVDPCAREAGFVLVYASRDRDGIRDLRLCVRHLAFWETALAAGNFLWQAGAIPQGAEPPVKCNYAHDCPGSAEAVIVWASPAFPETMREGLFCEYHARMWHSVFEGCPYVEEPA